MTRFDPLARLGVLAILAGVTLAMTAGCASGSRFDGPDGDRRLYEARCGFCHVPFAPGDLHPDDWPAVVEDMGPRAGLDAAYRARVARYLVRESTRVWSER
jgi:hypothetical protein